MTGEPETSLRDDLQAAIEAPSTDAPPSAT